MSQDSPPGFRNRTWWSGNTVFPPWSLGNNAYAWATSGKHGIAKEDPALALPPGLPPATFPSAALREPCLLSGIKQELLPQLLLPEALRGARVLLTVWLQGAGALPLLGRISPLPEPELDYRLGFEHKAMSSGSPDTEANRPGTPPRPAAQDDLGQQVAL